MARTIAEDVMAIATATLFEIEGRGEELFSIRDLQDEVDREGGPATASALEGLRSGFAKIKALKVGEAIEVLGWKLRRVA